MVIDNVYEDERRADAYAKLEFPGTYYLAYRDLPAIIAEHVEGRTALDFGCGTGRSTRFLKGLGFDAIGIDIAREMIERARARDPEGHYELIDGEDLGALRDRGFDLVLAVFTFDNVPTTEQKVALFRELSASLSPKGRIISVVSSPDIYRNEWASFTTKDFPENHQAKTGDRVRIVMTDVEDARPVEDVLCEDSAYREIYRDCGLEVVDMRKPLAIESEPFAWVNETRIAPWVIYVLGRATSPPF